jgi:hypothetical protein
MAARLEQQIGRRLAPVVSTTPGAMDSTRATLQVAKNGPDVGLAGFRRPLASSINFRILFTIGQTLPPFPASIGKPDGYPLPCLTV